MTTRMFGNTSLFIPNPVMYGWLMMRNAWNMVTVMAIDNGRCGLVNAINSNQTGIWRLLVVQNAVVTRYKVYIWSLCTYNIRATRMQEKGKFVNQHPDSIRILAGFLKRQESLHHSSNPVQDGKSGTSPSSSTSTRW
ncbi:hypothetical protein CPB85DRAFT_1249708 [Mucidula mucida]|nr:hypothetical protein CPB85DRAFT_1249708 [Mucidula mucida]